MTLLYAVNLAKQKGKVGLVIVARRDYKRTVSVTRGFFVLRFRLRLRGSRPNWMFVSSTRSHLPERLPAHALTTRPEPMPSWLPFTFALERHDFQANGCVIWAFAGFVACQSSPAFVGVERTGPNGFVGESGFGASCSPFVSLQTCSQSRLGSRWLCGIDVPANF
jgi:hypothetical protein